MNENKSRETSTPGEQSPAEEWNSTRLKEANACIGLGVGVGALGVGGALLTSAVCPLCIVITPALIGAGIIQRRRVDKERAAQRRDRTLEEPLPLAEGKG